MPDQWILQDLRNIQERLTKSGRQPSVEKLQQYYGAFRDRFGLERLSSLDGEALPVTVQTTIWSAFRRTTLSEHSSLFSYGPTVPS